MEERVRIGREGKSIIREVSEGNDSKVLVGIEGDHSVVTTRLDKLKTDRVRV